VFAEVREIEGGGGNRREQSQGRGERAVRELNGETEGNWKNGEIGERFGAAAKRGQRITERGFRL